MCTLCEGHWSPVVYTDCPPAFLINSSQTPMACFSTRAIATQKLATREKVVSVDFEFGAKTLARVGPRGYLRDNLRISVSAMMLVGRPRPLKKRCPYRKRMAYDI